MARGVNKTSQSEKNARQLPGGDIALPLILFVIAALALIIIGLVMVYSASSIVSLNDSGDPAATFKEQLLFVGLGIVLAAIAAIIPYHVWRGKMAWLGWGIVVFLLGGPKPLDGADR
jgi:cell division protein FtsW